jgi:hypothetical protein
LAGNKVSERALLKPEEKGLSYLVAYEFQLIDDERHEDAKRGKERITGALYGFAEPTSETSRAAGEWNESRLIVRGKSLEHWLNGTKVLDVAADDAKLVERVKQRWAKYPDVLDDYFKRRDGPSPIALQNHGDSAVWFRNIKIRLLQ